MSDDRPIVYVENGIPVYRASAVGRALRCLLLARIGETPKPSPEYLLEAAAAGHAWEPRVKAMMVEMGYTIPKEGDQDEIEIRVPLSTLWAESEYALIRGHLDGLTCIGPDDPTDRMLEVKSMSANVWARWKVSRFRAFPEYGAQVSSYMNATGKEAYYAVVNRETGELEITVIETPPVEVDALIGKVTIVEQLALTEELPLCDSTTYPCAYAYRCNKGKVTAVSVDGEMVELIQQYGDISATEKMVVGRKEEIKGAMGSLMTGIDKLKTPVGTVWWQQGQKTLNRERLAGDMREKGLELDDYYEESTSRYLVVRPKK